MKQRSTSSLFFRYSIALMLAVPWLAMTAIVIFATFIFQVVPRAVVGLFSMLAADEDRFEKWMWHDALWMDDWVDFCDRCTQKNQGNHP
jgi:hypothetical protein